MDDTISSIEGIFGKPLGRKAKVRLVALLVKIEEDAYERGRYEKEIPTLDDKIPRRV